MSDLTGQNLRRFHSRDDTGGHRVADDRPVTPRPIRRLNAPITQPFPVAAASNDMEPGDHVGDLIAGYALGALEPDEKLAVDRHIEYCPSCARLLAETRRTAAMLPFVAAPAGASPVVKATLFARIAQSSAAVTAERADEFAWARPVTPRNPATLPGSGTWLESVPVSETKVPAHVLKPRRSRRSIGQIAGISLPVLFTFGLIAFFVVPQIMPSNDAGNPQLVELLRSGPTGCADGDLALVTSTTITSACGFVNPQVQADNSFIYGLQIRDLFDDASPRDYSLSIPLTDGTYQVVPNSVTIERQQGQMLFTKPANASEAPICLIGRGEDPNLVCPSLVTPAA